MKDYSLQHRANLYSESFPKFPPLQVNKQISGMWIMGNSYKTLGGYGSYPHGYLKRIMSMFPDSETILHLFSASIPKGEYTRFDFRPEFADVVGDAHNLLEYFHEDKFDLILVDPPYSIEDSEHYGTPMVRRNVVLQQCVKVCQPKGYIVWLDQVLPMYRKDELKLVGVIGMVKSTNHRFRVITIFQKV